MNIQDLKPEKMLITFDNWFVAPDGNQYKSAWGLVQVYEAKDILNLLPNKQSSNWFIHVGNQERGVIVAGCQIHYAVFCPERPKDNFKNKTYLDKETGHQFNISKIYIAE